MSEKRTWANLAVIGALITSMVVTPGAQASPDFKVLVFSKTAPGSTRHASIPDAIAAIQSLGTANNFEVVATEDPTVFTDSSLAPYNAIIFALTAGDVLSEPQQAAFERHIAKGKGFVGIHSAIETENDWAFYRQMLGTSVSSIAKGNPTLNIITDDSVHPSTSLLPGRWAHTDELYNFSAPVRSKAHVLTSTDDRKVGGTMGYDHPISWCQGHAGGRVWYTSLGHNSATYSSANFKNHLLGGIKYASANAAGNCAATVESSFDKVILDDNMNQPMSLAVAPDGRVIFLERFGNVKIYKANEQRTVIAAKLDVSYEYDHGLQGIALDPAFSTNRYVYLFYTRRTLPEVNRLSRFKLNGDVLDLASETVLISYQIYPHCCHQGGSIAFDPAGNLYLTTGDDITPSYSDGYAPIDERPGRKGDDAQGTAANNKDLRGKILKIKPTETQQPNGKYYTVPPGNLFPSDGSAGLPEIFVMGTRNPFRMAIDPQTSWVYWGDVGPDANYPNDNRGPRGHDEVNQARGPGNFGWPYCITDNSPWNASGWYGAYRDYDFATGLSGGWSDCNAPTNTSPNNTGSQTLPPSKAALFSYHYGYTDAYPNLSAGNRTAQVGPLYRALSVASDTKLPSYYEGSLFVYDWSRNWIKEVKLDSSGNVLKINDFMPGTGFKSPIEMEQGPDGSLYVLEFGTTTDYANYVGAQLVRIDYTGGVRRPVIKTDKTSSTGGPSPLTVNFSAEGSYDPDPDDRISYAWDFQDDGVTDATTMAAAYTYPRGDFTAKLTVTDSTGRSSFTRLTITSGNSKPTVVIRTPIDGSFHRMGDHVLYDLSVTDVEDGVSGAGIPCADIVLTVAQVHDRHTHPTREYRGCRGQFETSDAGHSGANVATAISASYKDRGASGVGSATGMSTAFLHPNVKQAEFFSNAAGIQVLSSGGDPLGGGAAVYGVHGNWIMYKDVNLAGIKAIGLRASSAAVGARFEIRAGSPSGVLIGQAVIPTTRTWTGYVEGISPVIDPGGKNDLYISFQRPTPIPTGDYYLDYEVPLAFLNWVDFLGTPAGLPVALPAGPVGATALSSSLDRAFSRKLMP